MAQAIKREADRARKPLTQARLKELLHYDPETGIFTRIVARNGNTALAGARAGNPRQHGYRSIDVDGVRYYEHRLAVLYMTGDWPVGKVDHRSTVRSENTWANLRAATDTQNVGNRRVNKTNHIGLKGVVEHSNRMRKKRFGARIKVDRKSIHLGWFLTPEEAHAAYSVAATKHFGAFARTE